MGKGNKNMIIVYKEVGKGGKWAIVVIYIMSPNGWVEDMMLKKLNSL